MACLFIEHNLDLIGRADWIIDLGPEGGDGGGELLFSGPFGEFLSVSGSPTAEALRSPLARVTFQRARGPPSSGIECAASNRSIFGNRSWLLVLVDTAEMGSRSARKVR